MAPIARAGEVVGSFANVEKAVPPPVLSPEEALQRSLNEYTEYYVKLGELRKQNEKQVEPLRLQNLEAQRLRQISQEMYKEQQQYSSKIKKSFDDALATSSNPPDVFSAGGDSTTAHAARDWWHHDAALIRMFFGRQAFAVQRHSFLAGDKNKNPTSSSNRAKKQRVLRIDSDDELADASADVMSSQLFSENEEDPEGGADDTTTARESSSKSKKHDDADDAGEPNTLDKDARTDKHAGDAASDDGADDDENGSVGSNLDDLDFDENGIDVNDAFDMEEGAMDFEDEG